MTTVAYSAEKAKVEKGRGELREDLDILEARLGTGTRQYMSRFWIEKARRKRKKKVCVFNS